MTVPGKDDVFLLPHQKVVNSVNLCINLAASPALLCGRAGRAALDSPELFVELVSLYFNYIHNIAHSVFHEPSFMRRLKHGNASLVHVYAMCALAARYSDNPIFCNIPPCVRGKLYATKAINCCHENMVSPDLETVQGFLLVGYYFGGEGNTHGKYVYIGLARLHAHLVPHENFTTPVLREEHRRTWLSIQIASHWSASDMAMEPTSFFDEPIYQPKIDDAEFHAPGPDLFEGPVSPSPKYGMWAQMAQTLNIFTKINTLLRRLSQESIPFHQYCEEAAILEHDLDRWEEDLPSTLIYNYDNFMHMIGKKMGQIFLSMHIGYYHFRQMLFFPFLDSRLTQSTTCSRAAKCKESATIVSNILRNSETTPGCKMIYFIYGHIAVISSSVQLHTLLFSDDQPERNLARDGLVSNFQYLMNLKLYWRVVDHHVTHLRIFQNSCKDSLLNPFALDSWMARFLTEHTSALSQRLTNDHYFSTGAGIAAADPINPVGGTTIVNNSGSQVEDTDELEAAGTEESEIGTADYNNLSRLICNQGMSGQAIVDSALSWLLDDQAQGVQDIY
ncbi:C6 transcription factor [Penicillium waksmanii]|uniref:C6 transcription factor n=1 Tax=Penicillium waksmanii TaxID=69791 RepID=UPI0025498E86|nr:C6 transcription factor [Penicillium waksmanii]KAJ5989307.1 C6 transcription factor [Penicillium waksmanii]